MDPFYFDQERLQSITNKSIISLGLQDCRANRVMEIDQDEERLWGKVEGDDPNLLQEVVICCQDNRFFFSCDCDPTRGAVKSG